MDPTIIAVSRWGNVAATIDPTTDALHGVAISIASANGEALDAFCLSIFGATSSYRLLAFAGAVPDDVSALREVSGGLPVNAAGSVQGITPLYEVVVPANSVFSDQFPNGPDAQGGTNLTLLLVRLNDGNLTPGYVSLSAWGHAVNKPTAFSGRAIPSHYLGR